MLKLHDFCNRARIKMGIGTGRCQDGVHIEALLLWPIVEIEETRRTARIKMGIGRSEEHTSELQSLMRISYAVFCLKKKTNNTQQSKDRRVMQNEKYSRNKSDTTKTDKT